MRVCIVIQPTILCKAACNKTIIDQGNFICNIKRFSSLGAPIDISKPMCVYIALSGEQRVVLFYLQKKKRLKIQQVGLSMPSVHNELQFYTIYVYGYTYK